MRGTIPEQEEKLLALFLDQTDPVGKEAGLERLCSWYRHGYKLRSPHPIRQRLNGLLFNASPRVVRWSLNAIAELGTATDNYRSTLETIHQFRNDPDVLAAGVGALVRLCRPDDVIEQLKQIGIPFEGAPLLAAAQHTNAFADKLHHQRIRPEVAAPTDLRMAVVLVGLDKAPENLFEPKYRNSEIVGVLNDHDDAIVSQYSVWAILENEKLGVEHLRIPFEKIPHRPENVRSWVYQLLGSSNTYAIKNREHLLVASEDTSSKVRLGLATGLRDTYFDGLDELTFDWLDEETAERVIRALLEHMARHAGRCPSYRERVISEYTKASAGSILRASLEAAATGATLYGDLKRISLQSDRLSLFGEELLQPRGAIVVNQNISGKNVVIGTVAGTNAKIDGGVRIIQNNDQLKDCLAELLKLLDGLKDEHSREGARLAQQAAETPNKSTIGKLLSWMTSAAKLAGYAVGASEKFNEVFGAIKEFCATLS